MKIKCPHCHRYYDPSLEIRQEKERQRARDYYAKNKHKWKERYQTRKELLKHTEGTGL